VNLRQIRIVLRERDNFGALDLALRFVLALAPRAYVKLGLVVLLPAVALSAALRWHWHWAWDEVWLAAAALAALAQGPFTLLAGRLLLDEPPHVLPVLGGFLRRSWPYLVAVTAYWLGLVLGGALLLVWLLPWMSAVFLREAVLLEQVSGVGSLRRSRQMISGGGSRALGLQLGLLGATLTTAVLADLLGQGILGEVLQLALPVGSLFEEGGSLFALFGFFASIPFVVTARFIAYIDMRTRRDGWDVQVRFLDMAATMSPGGHG
jgi:hypothetical protein